MAHDRLKSIEQRIHELRDVQDEIKREYEQRAHKSPSVFTGGIR